jgi:hypothetical protein
MILPSFAPRVHRKPDCSLCSYLYSTDIKKILNISQFFDLNFLGLISSLRLETVTLTKYILKIALYLEKAATLYILGTDHERERKRPSIPRRDVSVTREWVFVTLLSRLSDFNADRYRVYHATNSYGGTYAPVRHGSVTVEVVLCHEQCHVE